MSHYSFWLFAQLLMRNSFFSKCAHRSNMVFCSSRTASLRSSTTLSCTNFNKVCKQQYKSLAMITLFFLGRFAILYILRSERATHGFAAPALVHCKMTCADIHNHYISYKIKNTQHKKICYSQLLLLHRLSEFL